MNTYSVVIDEMIAGDTRSELEPEIGDWANVRYYNENGDVRWAEGVITEVLENWDE
jgi:hypothetical protein